MFSFSVLLVLVSLVVAQSYIRYLSDVTYSDTSFGVDFNSKGPLSISGGYYYFLGSFAAYNGTTTAKFEFTRDATCSTSNEACSAITLYEEKTELSSTTNPTNVISKGTGESLVVSTDYEYLSTNAIVAKYFYANVACCSYNVVASATTQHA